MTAPGTRDSYKTTTMLRLNVITQKNKEITLSCYVLAVSFIPSTADSSFGASSSAGAISFLNIGEATLVTHKLAGTTNARCVSFLALMRLQF